MAVRRARRRNNRFRLFRTQSLTVLAVVSFGTVLAATSVDIPHDSQEHGASVMSLSSQMAALGRNGLDRLTQDDVSRLFLRYKRKYNRTYSGNQEMEAFRGFSGNVHKIIGLQHSPLEILHGAEIQINELADISEELWASICASGRRSVSVPFAQPKRGQGGATVAGSMDWTKQRRVIPSVLTIVRKSAREGTLLGQVEALGGCLDALFLKDAGVNDILPRGGFGYMAAAGHRALVSALSGSGANTRLLPAGAFVLPSDDDDENVARVAMEAAKLPEDLRKVLVDKARPPGLEDDVSDETCLSEDGIVGGEKERREDAAVEREGLRARRAVAWLQTQSVEFRAVPHGDELMLQAAVNQNGPVVVSMDLSDPVLQFYRTGVYTGGSNVCNKRAPTHAVLLVGYTDDYWILKNSWGRSWGEEGYMRVKRGDNVCGIATNAVYAVSSD